jgi:hypothetical protein
METDMKNQPNELTYEGIEQITKTKQAKPPDSKEG